MKLTQDRVLGETVRTFWFKIRFAFFELQLKVWKKLVLKGKNLNFRKK